MAVATPPHPADTDARILRTVVVDPERSETVYVGTLEHGVLRSTDGGVTWQPFGTRLPRQDVQALAFDPRGTGSTPA